ncbi:MAG: MmcQ/YjbR family DNA-binding protein [Alphaproteobacteria bacterium]|nr:MmcQ/YjbR family DNA-binding protein [Alphaproteobacteria bacterium]
MAATWKDVQQIAATLPGVVESTSYGTPSLRAGKVFLTRLRSEDGSLVVRMPMDEREIKMQAAPEIYHITDHYRAWPAVLVRLAKVSKGELKGLLERSWREVATKKMLAAYDAAPAARRKPSDGR